MVASVPPFDLQILDEVDSTNNHIKRAIKNGAKEGTAVLAYTQTSGYGRRGHNWKSPEGGMYLSLLLRPADHIDFSEGIPSDLPTLSLLASLAVRDSLKGFLDNRDKGAEDDSANGSAIKIKWPNDVMVVSKSSGRESIGKICGISLEVVGSAICIGIGVNVHPSHDSNRQDDMRASSDGRQYSVAYLDDLFLQDASISIDRIAESILESMASYYARWISGGFAPFVAEYDDADLLTERSVVIEGEDGQLICSIEGVDALGNLRAVDAHGMPVNVSSERSHIRFYEHS